MEGGLVARLGVAVVGVVVGADDRRAVIDRMDVGHLTAPVTLK